MKELISFGNSLSVFKTLERFLKEKDINASPILIIWENLVSKYQMGVIGGSEIYKIISDISKEIQQIHEKK